MEKVNGTCLPTPASCTLTYPRPNGRWEEVTRGGGGGVFGDLLAARTLNGSDALAERAGDPDEMHPGYMGMGMEDIEDLDNGFGPVVDGLEAAPMGGFNPSAGVEVLPGPDPVGVDHAFSS